MLWRHYDKHDEYPLDEVQINEFVFKQNTYWSFCQRYFSPCETISSKHVRIKRVFHTTSNTLQWGRCWNINSELLRYHPYCVDIYSDYVSRLKIIKSNFLVYIHNVRWYPLRSSKIFNPVWINDTIKIYRSGSTMAQKMTCCMTAPSHYLNQRLLITKGVLWYQSESNFNGCTHE